MPDFEYDLFISHASEDKAGFVRDLVDLLEQHGLRVWFDAAELQVGDGLVRSIEDGLRRSRFGVVVLSPAFFAKRWPRAELDALASREISSGDRVVLPIWLGVGEAEVREYSPLLADKLALRSDEGLEAIAAKLERRVRGSSSTGTPVREPSKLEPELLRGRVLVHSYSPIVQGDDHALISRVALAARVPTAPEPTLRPATQKLFEETLANSPVESLLQELTGRLRRRPSPEHFWRLVDPTKSWVITAARPAAKMVVDGWTAEARSSISVKHTPSVGPLGWLILHLDVAIRPLVAVPTVETKEWVPLSLDDLFALVYVPLTALLDEVAPAVLPVIGADPELLAVSGLLLPYADPFSRYVRLSTYARGRVEGATEPCAIDWYPSSLAQIATLEARIEAVRERIAGLFLDGGYRDFEHELERLGPPALGPAAPT